MSLNAVFLDSATLDDLDFSALQACFDTLTLHSASTPEQVVERLRGAQVAISNKVPLTEPPARAASPCATARATAPPRSPSTAWR